MFVKIKALKDITRNGLLLGKAGASLQVYKHLADELVESGDAELVEGERKPVSLEKLLAATAPKPPKEKNKN